MSTPAIDGGLVCLYSGDGFLCAYDAQSGSQVWTNDINRELTLSKYHGVNCSPLIMGDLVLLSAGRSGIAVDKRTGKTVWKGEDYPAGARDNFSHDSSPVPFEISGRRGVAFLILGSGIVGVDPLTGTRLWECPYNRYEEIYLDVNFRGDEALMAGHRWFKAGGTGQCIRAGSETNKNWSQSYMCNLILWKDCVLGFKEREKPLSARSLYCMDWNTGRIRWEAPDVVQGGMILVNDRLIVTTGDGFLVVAAPGDQGCTKLMRLPLRGPPKDRWYQVDLISTPAYGDNRVYYRFPGVIGCYDLKAK